MTNKDNMRKYLILALLLSAMCSCSPGGRNSASSGPAAFVPPHPQDVVMYQVNPRNFAPRNSFNAVRNHLDSIAELGTNVVWFMPIFEIGELKSVNSPYCVKDYRSVNPEFGTVEDFKSLVRECHARDMAVIIDWVANHTSWDNPWIYEHPDWYTKGPDGEIISPEGTGWNDVADLNFDNPEMCAAMIDAMKFWVTEVGVDGFRCDAADFVPFGFWKDCVYSLRAIEGRSLLMLAEGQRKDHFDAGFDMNYAWQWLSALRRVYSRGRAAAPASSLFQVDSAEYAGIPAGCVKLRFTTNHDECTKMSPVQEFFGPEGSMAAFVATSFIHGGMLVYGSQEVGYPGAINFFNYTKVDWNANSEMYEEYCRLAEIYNESPAIRKGELKAWPDDDVLMFSKTAGDEEVLVVVNMRASQDSIALPEEWHGRSCTELAGKEKMQLSDSLTLMPFEYVILK